MAYGVPINLNQGLSSSLPSPFGGLKRGPDQKFDYFIVDGCTKTTPVKLAAGQVLKARTWLQRNAAGKAEAYGAFNQSYEVTLTGSWAATETVVIAGITWTADAATDDADIAKAFAAYSDLQRNGHSADISSHPEAGIGTFSGTFTGEWTFSVEEASEEDSAASTKIIVSSTAPRTMVTALTTPTESAAAGTISTTLKGNAAETLIHFSGSGLLSTGTVTIGGVIYTASATNTPAEVVAAFVAGSSAKGAFSGSNAGFTFSAASNSNVLKVVGTTATVPVAASTSAAVTALQIAMAPSINKPVIGMLTFDVDATSADTWTSMFTEIHAYMEGVKWENVPGTPALPLGTSQEDTYEGVDYVVGGDGTAVQCTSYWTGVNDYASALQFIENSAGGTEFKITSWELTPGEKRNVR